MAIEDVDYLLDHSTNDSVLLFIDSAKRNRSQYTTPSEYVVQLEEPIRNVFGFDILDASIPSTMYNVDLNNNELRMILIDTTLAPPPTGISYDGIPGELYALGKHTVFDRMITDSLQDHYAVILDPDFAPQQQHPLSSTTDMLTAPVYAAFVRKAFVGVPLIPSNEPVDNVRVFNILNNNGEEKMELLDASGSTENIAMAQWLAIGGDRDYAIVPSSTPWATSVYSGIIEDMPLLDIIYFEYTQLTESSYNATKGGGGIRMHAHVVMVTLEIGNYTLATLMEQMQIALAPYAMEVGSTTSSTVDKQSKFLYSAPETTRFVFCVDYKNTPFLENTPPASSATDLLGFDVIQTDIMRNNNKFELVRVGRGQTMPTVMSTLRTVMGTNKSVIEAPGLINLLGTRFITLRCPEIEDHIGSTGKYGKYSAGIGVFKFSGTSTEMAQLRFDFVSLVRKPFHPIGKLNRLTLRFELSDGTQYDFKGINHQIMLTIKYYVPGMKRGIGNYKNTNTMLNPDYSPDFMQYMFRAAEESPSESESTSDSESYSAPTDNKVLLQYYKNDFFFHKQGNNK